MAYICDNCGKSVIHGRQSMHGRGVAGKRWKKRAQKTFRTFKPNLQKIAGMKLCASCIKKFRKEGKIKRVQSSGVKKV
jgi:ribosomal protein L28